MAILLCTFVIGLIAIGATIFQLFKLFPRPRIHHTTTTSIQNLLDPDDPINALLIARSIPNHRLVRTFELTNTFVTPDVSVHGRFRNSSLRLLSSGNDWHRLSRVVGHAINHFYPLSGTPLPMHAFVQSVTLQTIILGLIFADSPDDTALDQHSALAVASLITELWASSKKPDTLDPRKLPLLKNHLKTLVQPLRGTSTIEADFPNLLDIIIPSWETLWRVVAAAIGRVHANEGCRRVLSTFISSPLSSEDFRRIDKKTGYSVEGIVLETMRLHPPSNHISRTASYLPPALSVHLPLWVRSVFDRTHVADVFEVQTSQSIWGENALEFDPSRQRHSDAFLAFGYGRLSCVAKTWAPMAVAIVIAEILEVIDGKALVLEAGPHIGGRGGWDGWVLSAVD